MVNQVMIQQFYLNCLGYNAGKVDGIYGERTFAAKNKFYKDMLGRQEISNVGLFNELERHAKEKLPRHLIVAAQYLGEKEIPGLKHNSKIVAMWEALKAKFRDDETPWCSAFQAKVIIDAKYPTIDEDYLRRAGVNAMAQSWEGYGYESEGFFLGDIAVFWRNHPESSSGHVGNAVGVNENGDLWILGGNQGNSVSVALIERRRLITFRVPNARFDWKKIPLPLITAKAPLSTNEA